MDENTRKLSEVIKAMNNAVAGDMTADDVEKIADGLADIIAGLKEELGDDCLTDVCPCGCDVSMHEIDDDLPIVINLFGAPGVGKSTAAAYLYHLLSSRGISTELVTEFAKDSWQHICASKGACLGYYLQPIKTAAFKPHYRNPDAHL